MSVLIRAIVLLTLPLVVHGGDDPPCTIRTVMGDPIFFSGEGGPASEARLHLPSGLVQAPDGTVFFADQLNNRIRAVSPDGVIRTVAGTGEPGFSGDGGPATEAELATPTELTRDSEGNLYFVDHSFRVRKVDTAGTITTVAGTGVSGYEGDGGPGTGASFGIITDIAVDSKGGLYIADWQHNRVRRVEINGTITTFAGNGSEASNGDGGPASLAGVSRPRRLVVDKLDNVYVFQELGWLLRRVDSLGIIDTVAGNGLFLPGEDSLPAHTVPLGSIIDLALDLDGNILLLENRGISVDTRIRRLQDGIIQTIATYRQIGHFAAAGDGGFFIAVSFAVAGASDQILKIEPDLTTVATFAGLERPSEDEGPTRYRFSPETLTAGPSGDMFVLNSFGNQVFRLAADGQVSTVAGGGEEDIADGAGLGDISITSAVRDIAVDSQGRLYLGYKGLVFRSEPGGTLSLVAGGGGTFLGILSTAETISALDAHFDMVERIAIGPDDSLYVASLFGPAVRITTDGQLRVLPVGRGGVQGYRFRVADLEVGPNGTMYLSDSDPNTPEVWKLPAEGPVEMLHFDAYQPKLAIDGANNLYRSEEFTVMRTDPDGYQVDMTSRSVNRFRFGEGQDSRTAHILGIQDLASDSEGNLFVIDFGLDRVRRITQADRCEGTRWPLVGAWTHAATYERLQDISAGQIITIFGQWLGPDEPTGGAFEKSQRLTTELQGVTVLFNGIPAPIVFAWKNQTSVIVPYEIPDEPDAIVDVDFLVGGRAARRASYRVASTSPGLFTLDASGAGQGAILNQDLSVNGPQNPAAAESIIVLFGTGMGRTTPLLETGAIVEPPLPVVPFDVSVTVGGVPAATLYLGAAPSLVAGVTQINAQLAPGTPTGDSVPVEWTIDGVTSRPVSVAIRP